MGVSRRATKLAFPGTTKLDNDPFTKSALSKTLQTRERLELLGFLLSGAFTPIIVQREYSVNK
jgi:hypothetical protein